MLFIQGTRDQFGTSSEIAELLPRLHGRAALFEVADGDHSFKTRVKVTGRKPDAAIVDVIDAAAAFMRHPADDAGAPPGQVPSRGTTPPQ